VLQRRHDIRERETVGVVEVEREFVDGDFKVVQERAKQERRFGGRALAGGVGDGDFGGVEVEEFESEGGDGVERGVGAFVGAAEGDGDVGADGKGVGFGGCDERFETF